MAVYTYIIKNTNKEVVVKVDAVVNATGTITLTDLTSDDQALISGGTPKVNIVKAIFTGELGSAIRITRNGENILACAPENAPILDLNSNGITENRHNDYDIDLQCLNHIGKLSTNRAVSNDGSPPHFPVKLRSDA